MNADSVVFRGYTAAELAAQYSARAAVPEHPAIFERWRAASAAHREAELAAGRARLGLAYGSGVRQQLDLFLPAVEEPPLHVFLHGGYWQAMDRSDFSFVAQGLAAAGLATAVVGYPLCPSVAMGDIVACARRALCWLLRECSMLGLGQGPVTVSGHSAGGQLALLLAQTEWRALDPALPPDPIAGVLPVSGIFELEPLIHTPLNDALQLDVRQARRWSPVGMPPPAAGVRLDAWVGADESAEFHRQSRALAEHWDAHRSPAAYRPLPGHNHFTILDALYAPGGELPAAAAALQQEAASGDR